MSLPGNSPGLQAVTACQTGAITLTRSTAPAAGSQLQQLLFFCRRPHHREGCEARSAGPTSPSGGMGQKSKEADKAAEAGAPCMRALVGEAQQGQWHQ